MAGTIIADRIEAAASSTLFIENGVALSPPTIIDVNGTEVGRFCRAWVNFNGVGTVAVRTSFNVSAVFDNGVGNYTVFFTNPMVDANYATGALLGNIGTGSRTVHQIANATTQVQLFFTNGASVGLDTDTNSVYVFR